MKTHIIKATFWTLQPIKQLTQPLQAVSKRGSLLKAEGLIKSCFCNFNSKMVLSYFAVLKNENNFIITDSIKKKYSKVSKKNFYLYW